MASFIIPDKQRDLWFKGANLRVEKAMGSEHKHWWGRLWHRTYDMGQNFDLALQELKARGSKEINWLALPGHEVCSTLVTSINHEGFLACGWDKYLLLELQKACIAHNDTKTNIRGTQDVDPALLHLISDKWMPTDPLYRVKKAGDEIKPYSIIEFMSYAEPSERNMVQIFIDLVKAPLTFMSTFSRGIKVYQFQKNRPYPTYLTTHSVLTLPPTDNQIRYISQEALTFIKYVSVEDMVKNQSGEFPRWIVLEPIFLYE